MKSTLIYDRTDLLTQVHCRHAPAQVAEALAQCNFHSVQWDEVGDEECGTLKEVTTFYQS